MTRRSVPVRTVFLVAAMTGFGFLGQAPAAAAPVVFRVTTTVDGGIGSLRAAVVAAAAAGVDAVVEVPAGTYSLSRCAADDTGAAGDLDLATAAPVTVRGSGAVTIRQTCAGERVLHARGGGRLTLDHVTITGGSVTAAAGTVAAGGGVWASGDVVLEGASLAGNSAQGGHGTPGLTATDPPGNGGAAHGGGLYVGGRLMAAYSVVRDNTARGGVGGGTPAGSGSVLPGGSGGAAEGGGVYVVAGVAVTGGTLTGNAAWGGTGGEAEGGMDVAGAAVNAGGGAGGAARGGAVAQAGTAIEPVALARLSTSGNRAVGGAIGVYRAQLRPVVTPPGTPPPQPLPPGGAATGGAVAAAGPLGVAAVTADGDQTWGGRSAGVCFLCGGGPESGAARGGSLAGAGRVAVAASTLRGNGATSGEALLVVTGRGSSVGYGAGPAEGGAVYAGGDAVVAGGIVSGNVAGNGRGLTGLASGGGVYAVRTMTVTGGTYSGNTGGAQLTPEVRGRGGAVAGGVVRLAGVTVTGNSAGGVGGGAWSAGALTVARSTVSGNHGMLIGGGLAAGGGAVLTDVSVRDNDVAGLGRTGGGGGIDTAGAVRLTRTVISGNKANARWGGGGVGPLPAQLSGGGVRAGSVVAVDSTVAGNVVTGGELLLTAPVPRGQQVTGGGIAAATSVDLTNTTVSGNSTSWATSVPDNPSARGAGVSAGSVRLVHATLTGNTLDDLTAGVPAAAAGTLQTATLSAVGSVIVPASGQRACTVPIAAEPSSFSVVGDTTCGLAGPGVRTDASGVALAALADNGGPVPTQLPGPGSTLVDAASVSPLAADARGVPRPQGPASDIGAVEVAAAP